MFAQLVTTWLYTERIHLVLTACNKDYVRGALGYIYLTSPSLEQSSTRWLLLRVNAPAPEVVS